MTSKTDYKEAFVWIWLPNETEPVVAGKLEVVDDHMLFNYGKSYLERAGDEKPAIAIYEPELPLMSGELPLLNDLSMPGCIRDAAPDAWGRRVIINKKLGRAGTDTGQLDELTYLLESGSDRIGALDFQQSATEYVPRSAGNVTLEALLESAERMEKGEILAPELDQALFHGSSIGGARPKALIEEGDKKFVAKFPLSSDLYSIVKAEFIAMRLAEYAGLNVAPVKLERVAQKDVLLIERFDREKLGDGWSRKALVSALTLFGLDEMMARYASYQELAEIIRLRFDSPADTLKELYSRMIFNILCGNTDDHARNHAALWDGSHLTLSPAYDICPQGRAGNEATQAMLISGDDRSSRVATCISAASSFLLSKKEAIMIFNKQKLAIETHWKAVCEEASLSDVDKKLFWQRQFLNPYVLENLEAALPKKNL